MEGSERGAETVLAELDEDTVFDGFGGVELCKNDRGPFSKQIIVRIQKNLHKDVHVLKSNHVLQLSLDLRLLNSSL